MVTSPHTSPSLPHCLSTQVSENGHLSRCLWNLWAAHWSSNTLPPLPSLLSWTLKHQEILLKQTEDELSKAFQYMVNHDFYNTFAFFITRKLNEQQQHSSPQSASSQWATLYQRPIPSPSQCCVTFQSPPPPSYPTSPQPERITLLSPWTIPRNPMELRGPPTFPIMSLNLF